MKPLKAKLKQACIDVGKEHYIRWISKYCKMTPEEKEREVIKGIAQAVVDMVWPEQKPTTWLDKFKDLMSQLSPSQRKLNKEAAWHRAFYYFRHVERTHNNQS